MELMVNVVQGDLFSGEYYRDMGMQKAEDHANEVNWKWSDKAYAFLQRYLRSHTGPFMTEQVREAAEGVVPTPPSGRAWGSIVVRAAKEGIIRKVGYRSVTNAKAHCTPATLWIKY